MLSGIEGAWAPALAKIPAAIGNGKSAVGNHGQYHAQALSLVLGCGLEAPAGVPEEITRLQATLETIVKFYACALNRDVAQAPITAIQEAMAPCYNLCLRQAGFGCVAKMGSLIDAHLLDKGDEMYQDIEDSARAHLDTMCKLVEHELVQECEGAVANIAKAFASVTVPEPEAVQRVRKTLELVMEMADDDFGPF